MTQRHRSKAIARMADLPKGEKSETPIYYIPSAHTHFNTNYY